MCASLSAFMVLWIIFFLVMWICRNFYKLSIYGKKVLSSICFNYVSKNFTFFSDDLAKPLLQKYLILIATKKSSLEILNTNYETKKLQTLFYPFLAHHKRRRIFVIMYSTICPILSTNFQDDLKYHLTKIYVVSKPNVTFKCKLRYEDFSAFHALR